MPEKYYKCIRPWSGFTVGKIYPYCGAIIDDSGEKREFISNLETWHPWFKEIKLDLENK